jgi:predicted dienelactone hydrolase
MKHTLLNLIGIFLIVLGQTNTASAAGFHFDRASGESGESIELAIWYPSLAQAQPFSVGPVTMSVATNGACVKKSLPLVLISHGTGASNLSHFDTAIALANSGYVVVALTHTGDNYRDQSRSTDILDRPRQVSRVLDHMLGAWRERSNLDPTRIGMFGFSAGGFTTLVSVGGMPDFFKIGPTCEQHPTDFACKLLAAKGYPSATLPGQTVLTDFRIKAAVVAAPALGFTFTQNGMKDVKLPIQLWRAQNDTILPEPRYAQAVYNALPNPPEYHQVANAQHLDFLSPCSAALATAVPSICTSEAGFDRSKFHEEFNASVIRFFNAALNVQ